MNEVSYSALPANHSPSTTHNRQTRVGYSIRNHSSHSSFTHIYTSPINLTELLADNPKHAESFPLKPPSKCEDLEGAGTEIIRKSSQDRVRSTNISNAKYVRR